MKKTLSVLLAVLCAFGAFGLIAFAEDGVTRAYTVSVAENSEGKFVIIPEQEGQTLIAEGGQFRFRIETRGGYQFDQTTRIKVFPAKTYYMNVVQDTVDAEYGTVLTPDENGVYTIDAVNEDLVVEAFNLDEGGFPWLKTFLMDLFNFFKRLSQWFFGLRKN